MKSSFIVPCLNEEGNVNAFYDEFKRAFDGSGFEWELIFVDDGSTDATYAHMRALSEHDYRVAAVSFSRNFGKEAAIWCGLQEATGDVVGIIDADLQQPPEDALAMVRILADSPEVDCVAAYQETRKGGVSKLSSMFYGVMEKATGMKMMRDASDFRVFRRCVADALLSMPEVHRFSKGMFAWLGFHTEPYPYTARDRASGESKWSVYGLFKYAAEGIVAFSTAPLKAATALGFIVSALAIIYCIVLIVQTLAYGIDVPGYATTLAAVLLLGGAQLLVLGVIGEYLSRVYIQGKQRPICVVRERHKLDKPREEKREADGNA